MVTDTLHTNGKYKIPFRFCSVKKVCRSPNDIPITYTIKTYYMMKLILLFRSTESNRNRQPKR